MSIEPSSNSKPEPTPKQDSLPHQPRDPMTLLNVIIPSVLLVSTIGVVGYLRRGIDWLSISAGVLIAGISSLGTQWGTQTGLFASATQKPVENTEKNNNKNNKKQPPKKPASPEITEDERLSIFEDRATDDSGQTINTNGKLGSDFQNVQALLEQNPHYANDAKIMDNLVYMLIGASKFDLITSDPRLMKHVKTACAPPSMNPKLYFKRGLVEELMSRHSTEAKFNRLEFCLKHAPESFQSELYPYPLFFRALDTRNMQTIRFALQHTSQDAFRQPASSTHGETAMTKALRVVGFWETGEIVEITEMLLKANPQLAEMKSLGGDLPVDYVKHWQKKADPDNPENRSNLNTVIEKVEALLKQGSSSAHQPTVSVADQYAKQAPSCFSFESIAEHVETVVPRTPPQGLINKPFQRS